MEKQMSVEDLSVKVQSVLQGRFREARGEAHRNKGAKRVSGSLITPDFNNLDQVDRQKAVHDALRDTLGPEAQGVSIILTYTPDEYKALREE